MMRQIWQEELDSHILDCAADLEQTGFDHASALVEAKKQFGDQAAVTHELQRMHPWLSIYADWIALIAFVVIAPVLYVTTRLAAASPIGFYAATFLLWWWPIALLMIAFGLVRWVRLIIPLRNHVIWPITLSVGFVFAATITIVLDINNFETAAYNAGLSVIFGLMGWILWHQLSRRLKLFGGYSITALMITSAWREHGYFESAVLPGCSYVQNTVLEPSALCHQVTWYDPRLLFIFIILVVAVGFITFYLHRLWHSQAAPLYQKALTTAVLALLPITPLAFHNVNSTGAIDVVPWKVQIDQAYMNILGRHPEAKDYDFYANTRSYEHMSRVKQVLYDSTERRLKINSLYEHILERSASEAEIDAYANSYMTIAEIRHELKKQAQ